MEMKNFNFWILVVAIAITFSTKHACCDSVRKGHVLDTFKTLHKMWKVSLSIKPLGVKNGFSSVLHATIGRDWQGFGDRTPAMFMHGGSTQLQICGPVNYPHSFYCWSSSPLKLNQFTHIEIQQRPNGKNKNLYTVKYDGQEVYRAYPNYIPTFHNVKVYEANPWGNPANVEMQNYKFHSGVSQGHLLETIPTLHKLWTLTFRVMPLGIVNGQLSNIIHTTNAPDAFPGHGHRTPMINFKAGTTMLQVCGAYEDPDKCQDIATLPLFKFTEVVVGQRMEALHPVFVHFVEIDGKQVFGVRNNIPQKFQNASVYASSPFHPAANVMLEDYKFYSGVQKGHIIDEIPCLGTTWALSISVKPTGIYQPWYSNILQATIGGSETEYGDRVPSISFTPNNTTIQICVPVNGNPLYCVTSPIALPLNVVSVVTVKQILANDGKYYFQVEMSGVGQFISVVNNDPREFKNVKVYASSPWNEPARAELEGIQISPNKNFP